MKYLILMLLLIGCSKKCDVITKVIDIGGCDRDGLCGVVLENGKRGRLSYPTIGQIVETECKF